MLCEKCSNISLRLVHGCLRYAHYENIGLVRISARNCHLCRVLHRRICDAHTDYLRNETLTAEELDAKGPVYILRIIDWPRPIGPPLRLEDFSNEWLVDCSLPDDLHLDIFDQKTHGSPPLIDLDVS